MSYELMLKLWYTSIPRCKSIKGALRVEAIKEQDSLLTLMDILKNSGKKVHINNLIEEIVEKANFKPTEDKWKNVCMDQIRKVYEEVFKDDITNEVLYKEHVEIANKSITAIYQKNIEISIENWVVSNGYTIKSYTVASFLEYMTTKEGTVSKTTKGYSFKDTPTFSICSELEKWDIEKYSEEYKLIQELFERPNFSLANVLEEYGRKYLDNLDPVSKRDKLKNIFDSIPCSGYEVRKWLDENMPEHLISKVLKFNETRSI